MLFLSTGIKINVNIRVKIFYNSYENSHAYNIKPGTVIMSQDI